MDMMSADELLSQALRYKAYWGDKGGITVSGGEPLLQMDFLLELFTKAKENGVHTVLDTSGNPFSRHDPFFHKFNRFMEVTDLLLLLDIKQIDSKRHKILTGCGNENILDMAKYLAEIRKPVWIRHVLVPEQNDYDEDLYETGMHLLKLEQCTAALRCCLITHWEFSNGRICVSRIPCRESNLPQKSGWRTRTDYFIQMNIQVI